MLVHTRTTITHVTQIINLAAVLYANLHRLVLEVLPEAWALSLRFHALLHYIEPTKVCHAELKRGTILDSPGQCHCA